MVCEFSIGRGSQKSCATSFKVLEKEGTKWHNYGYLAVVGNYLLMMFYTMVAGWTMYYCYRCLKGEFTEQVLSSAQIKDKYLQMTESAPTMLLWTIIAIVLSFAVCALGVQKGVERVTKVMMICLFALIVVLAVNSVMLPGAGEGIKFYLIPDFKDMVDKGIGNVVFGAMSQSFFTLSIGIGAMTIFGSYLDKDRSLAGETLSITFLDTFVATMSGLIIIPACFSFGIEPDAGPSLIFLTLPRIFNQMAGGYIWGALFFLFLAFAALSTVIAVFENIVAFAIDLWNWSRGKAVIVNIVLITVLSIPCILGFNVLSDITPLGAGTNIMDLEDFLVSNNLLPLGSLVYILFCTRKNGWGWDNFIAEANAGEGKKLPKKLKFYMSYILPAIIVIIYIKGYYDMFSPKGLNYLIPWMIVAFALLGFVAYFALSKGKKQAEK